MTKRRVLSLKLVAFALTPAFLLVLSAEATLRLKYFFAHGHDWAYLVTPFGGGNAVDADILTFVKTAGKAAPTTAAAAAAAPKQDAVEAPNVNAGGVPKSDTTQPPQQETRSTQIVAQAATSARATAPPNDEAQTAPKHETTPAPDLIASPRSTPQIADAPETDAMPLDQMIFKWQKPCVDQMVYSSELRKAMPRTWDENCLRGDRVPVQKGTDEYRIMFMGGSTVEDAQSDDEMMATRFKRTLPATFEGKRITVVNAGKVGYESRRIFLYWASRLRAFSPDLVLYYEAWNEQPTDVKWTRADQRIAAIGNSVHSTLYHRSMLYTYLVEKFAFFTASADPFWKIDVKPLQQHFVALADDLRRHGTRLVFVTQVIRFPRMWKRVDTFDYSAVDALLDRLRSDRSYSYDVTEISALNQRLAVAYTLELCRQNHVPVVNILDPVEALGEQARSEMFVDLGHLTPKGDKIVGELIAKRLNLSD